MHVHTSSRTNSNSVMRGPHRILLAIVCVCALAGVALWLSYESVQKTPLAGPSEPISALGNSAGNNRAANNSSFVSLLPNDGPPAAMQARANSEASKRANNDLGLFNETARSLMRSNVPAKIDYGRYRAYVECRSLAYGNSGIKVIKELALPASTIENRDSYLHYGLATDDARIAGFSRSIERCGKLFEGAPLLSEELVQTKVLPGVMQSEAIRATLRDAPDFDDPKTKAALLRAVSEPMLGTLDSLVLNKVDYSELTKFYSENQVASLQNLVFELVLCRMGDDCGRGGIVTEQLCWQNGICGDNAEEAILSSLRERGLDTTGLIQFVTRVNQALQVGDTSIFRKQTQKK